MKGTLIGPSLINYWEP